MAVPSSKKFRMSVLRRKSREDSTFSNFEYDQLTSDERLYLFAASTDDMYLIKEFLLASNLDQSFNYDCVDYMGKNALHMAVDADSMDMVEFLMDIVSWECIEEALLHAISKGSLPIVRKIVDHPKFVSEENNLIIEGRKDSAFHWPDDTKTYPIDITPIILAAHNNDHEIVQLFLSKGFLIERPHATQCPCDVCRCRQEADSLKRSLSRFNTYKALASPAYIALSSQDPITTMFELRQEIMMVSDAEKEFKNDYLALVDQCMDFGCQCMNLCRSTHELEAIISDVDKKGEVDPLARLRLAVDYEEKRFVAHPNTQQHLTNVWYCKEMLFLQSLSWMWNILLLLFTMIALPFACVLYIVNPNTKLGKIMRCPVSKFITHTLSHIMFLALLATATFVDWSYSDNKNELILQKHFRAAKWSITPVHILLIFWVIGNMCLECKQVYANGAQEHFLQFYNILDFTTVGLYLTFFSLRFATMYRVVNANKIPNTNDTYTETAMSALKSGDTPRFIDIVNESRNYSHNRDWFFISPSRYDWQPGDPEIVADVLFAIANILSFARTVYVMPAHELLGPLQISLGRMFSDIARFFVLFIVVLVAFMVGMTNLYVAYMYNLPGHQQNNFIGMPQTLRTLFFSIFGLMDLKQFAIVEPNISYYHSQNHTHGLMGDITHLLGGESTKAVETVGLLLFAVFQVTVTIVLVNMLIAMMSHSFEAIQCDNDVEWKFARTKLWLEFINEKSTLPVPFNIIPTPKSFVYAFKFCKELFKDEEEEIQYNTGRRRGQMSQGLEILTEQLAFSPETAYFEIIQRLMRRYLFQMNIDKKEPCDAGQHNQANNNDDATSFDASERDLTSISEVDIQKDNPKLPKSDGSFKRKKNDGSTLLQYNTSKKSNRSHSFGNHESYEVLKRSIKIMDVRIQDLLQKTFHSHHTIQHHLEETRDMTNINHGALVNILENQEQNCKNIAFLSQVLHRFTTSKQGQEIWKFNLRRTSSANLM